MGLTPTNATCIGNGQVTVNIAGTQSGATFDIVIYKLPNVTVPYYSASGIAATSSTLTSTISLLQSGNYSITVTQHFGAQTNQQNSSFTIVNNYVPLSFTYSTQRNCIGMLITVNVTAGSALSYELRTSSNTVVVPAQSSNILGPVGSGTYNIIVTDVCGNSTSLSITIAALTSVYSSVSVGINGFGLLTAGCDSIKHVESLVFNGNGTLPNFLFPIQVNYTVSNPFGGGNFVVNRVWSSTTSNNNEEIHFPFYSGQSYTITIVITDACGHVYSRVVPINAVSNSSTIVNVGNCGNKYITIYNILYHNPPFTITFTNYPPGFTPSSYNPNFPAGQYTAVFNSIVSSVSIGGNSNTLPPGNYQFNVTSCSGSQTHNITISSSPIVYGLTSETYGGCLDDEGSIRITICNPPSTNQVDNIVSAKIIAAPSTFGFALPYSINTNINSDGRLYMNSLPEGTYTFEMIGQCGVTVVKSIDIHGRHFNSTITPTLHCGSFDLSVNLSSYLGFESIWLQKYNTSTGQWGHPTTGTPYINGTINSTNGQQIVGSAGSAVGYLPIAGSLTNISGSGLFRVMVQSQVHSNGSYAWINCVDMLEEITIPSSGILLNNYYVSECVNGSTELIIDALGAPPLNYSLTSFNGVPVNINNGTSPVFSGLSQGIYSLKIEDNCGNTNNFSVLTTSPISPSIVPSNLCDGQVGSLSISGLSFLTTTWTKNPSSTIIGTGNTLLFNPFDDPLNAGTYNANITYSGNPASCLNEILSFTIPAGTSIPDAGVGGTYVLMQGSIGVINLFDYLSGAYDSYGDWSENSSSGTLVGQMWNASSLPTGTYSFDYLVDGVCSGSDFSTVVFTIEYPLPIELSEFSGNCVDENNEILWSTESESNSKCFKLESSSNGQFWEEIYTVEAAGNSTSRSNYSFVDFNVESDLIYYRLNKYDIDGDSIYFGPISVSCSRDFNSLVVYQNENNIIISLVDDRFYGKNNIQILDNSGKLILDSEFSNKNNDAVVSMEGIELVNGMYFIRVTNELGYSKVVRLYWN